MAAVTYIEARLIYKVMVSSLQSVLYIILSVQYLRHRYIASLDYSFHFSISLKAYIYTTIHSLVTNNIH